MSASKSVNIKKLASIAMLSAVAFAVMYLSKMVPILVAGFLRPDFKDVIIVISGLIFGPLSAAAVAIISSFIEMVTISTTGPIGFVMNVISSCTFCCIASVFYSKNRKLSSAILGLVVGVITVTIVMLLWNYILVPVYTPTISRSAVASMLFPIFLPFNLLKYGINAALSMLLYKPLIVGLRKAKLVNERSDGNKGKINLGVTVVSIFLILTLVLLFLILAKVI